MIRARAVYAVAGVGITSIADLTDDIFAEVNFYTLTAPSEVSVKGELSGEAFVTETRGRSASVFRARRKLTGHSITEVTGVTGAAKALD